jgi:BolA protein
MSALSTQETIETRIRERLAPIHLEVIDDGAQHAGHAGAASGGGHFSVLLQDMMQGAIHALALRTVAPSEWSR